MNELTRRDFVCGGLTAGIGIGVAPELLRSAVARQAQAPAPAAGADPYAMVDPELLDAIKKFPFLRFLRRRRSHLNGTYPVHQARRTCAW
jgi:hypothetical protein